MALTNNTKFRNTILTIIKKVNGAVDTTGGFPLQVSILSAFTGYAAITEANFLVLNDTDYTLRLNAFYTYLEGAYPFFSRNSALNASNGIDAVSCPLTNIAPPVLTVTGYKGNLSSSGSEMYLTWDIQLDGAARQDTPFSFVVVIFNAQMVQIATRQVTGIIQTGVNNYNSPLIGLLIQEGYGIAGATMQVAPGSLVISL